MKTYTIVAGVNGVGKSSLSGVLRAERSDLGHIIDVDRIAAERGLSPISAGRAAIAKIDALLSAGASITQETTLAGQRTVKIIKTARELGYKTRLFYIGLNSCQESVARIRNRVEKGGHNIDSKTVAARFNTRFDALLKILPLCDEAYFFDNENGFVEAARYRNGDLTANGGTRPEWLNELTERLRG